LALPMTNHLATIVQRVCQSLIDEYGYGPADITVTQGHDGTTVVMLSPPASSAARIVVNVESDESLATLIVGQGAVFEVPAGGRRYTNLDAEGEIRAICEAAILGRLREEVWIYRGEVVRARTEIVLDGRPVRNSWRQLPQGFVWWAEKRTHTYSPYGPSSNA
jgi:hypothetical protein